MNQVRLKQRITSRDVRHFGVLKPLIGRRHHGKFISQVLHDSPALFFCQRIAEAVASMVAAGVANENRMTGEDGVDRMLKRRDDLIKFLSTDDVASTSAAAIVRPIELMADWDLRYRIAVDAMANWRLLPGEDPNEPPQRLKDSEKVDQALEMPDRLAGLAEVERLLKGELKDRISYGAVEKHVTKYRALLENGRLPRMGPAGDVRKAPAF